MLPRFFLHLPRLREKSLRESLVKRTPEEKYSQELRLIFSPIHRGLKSTATMTI